MLITPSLNLAVIIAGATQAVKSSLLPRTAIAWV